MSELLSPEKSFDSDLETNSNDSIILNPVSVMTLCGDCLQVHHYLVLCGTAMEVKIFPLNYLFKEFLPKFDSAVSSFVQNLSS